MGRDSGEILVVMGDWSLDVRVVVGVGVLVYEGWRWWVIRGEVASTSAVEGEVWEVS